MKTWAGYLLSPLVLLLFCCTPPTPITQVMFDGPIYIYTQYGETHIAVSVINVGQTIAYNVIATILIKKDDVPFRLFELDYDLIPPGETETIEKRVKHLQFGDNIKVTGTLRWD